MTRPQRVGAELESAAAQGGAPARCRPESHGGRKPRWQETTTAAAGWPVPVVSGQWSVVIGQWQLRQDTAMLCGGRRPPAAATRAGTRARAVGLPAARPCRGRKWRRVPGLPSSSSLLQRPACVETLSAGAAFASNLCSECAGAPTRAAARDLLSSLDQLHILKVGCDTCTSALLVKWLFCKKRMWDRTCLSVSSFALYCRYSEFWVPRYRVPARGNSELTFI